MTVRKLEAGSRTQDVTTYRSTRKIGRCVSGRCGDCAVPTNDPTLVEIDPFTLNQASSCKTAAEERVRLVDNGREFQQ